MAQKLTVIGGSAVAAEMRGNVVRCGCGQKNYEELVARHGFQAGGVNLNACPTPRVTEYDAFVLRWRRLDLAPLMLFLAFAVGAAAMWAAGQLWAMIPLLIGATLQVNGGRAIVTNRLRGSGTEPLHQAWGTGAGTTAAADTTLFTEALVSLAAGTTDHTAGTSTQQTTSTTNDTYQVIATRTATGSGTVTNAGLFDAASGGNLYMKGDFTGIGLASGDAIQFTNKVQYT